MIKYEIGESIQAVFIDRDGTIGGTGHFVHPDGFEVFPCVPEALSLLKNHAIKILACTNQNRISEGRATEDDFRREFASLGFDDAYICPHPSDSECDCRKPRVGLLLRAARDYGLDLRRCVFIGDTGATDMLAADRVGAIKILVRTGWGESSLNEYRYTWAGVEPDYVAEHLLDAVRWVLAQGDHVEHVEPVGPTNASIACIDRGRVLLVERSPDERSFAGRPKGPIALSHDHRTYAWIGCDDPIEGRFRCSPEVRSIAIDRCCSGGRGCSLGFQSESHGSANRGREHAPGPPTGDSRPELVSTGRKDGTRRVAGTVPQTRDKRGDRP